MLGFLAVGLCFRPHWLLCRHLRNLGAQDARSEPYGTAVCALHPSSVESRRKTRTFHC
ncbi:MAG: hypothetical protein Greene041662_485 [Candidatus Peregrinibacteria bacterium Greene0416_62]|nr:MAG: hypothetical protein Greene041662_485 [Candidatus Peregrinibacteria bacterium Greene0416_62]TSC97796.1 MAG: hypothetical protein Greene101449_1091 [Candidatus Peregrinibacteria bacterium Greene1014_49]